MTKFVSKFGCDVMVARLTPVFDMAKNIGTKKLQVRLLSPALSARPFLGTTQCRIKLVVKEFNMTLRLKIVENVMSAIRTSIARCMKARDAALVCLLINVKKWSLMCPEWSGIMVSNM